jgi:hypothetical protein
MFVSTNIKYLLLFFGISAIPLYIFPSGGVQPCHLIFAILILSSFKKNIHLSNLDWFMFLFFIYVAIVEFFYGIIFSDITGLANPLYFFYNFLLVFAFNCIFKEGSFKAVKYGFIVALFIAFASIIISGVDLKSLNDEGRPVGTFNNPNQLGYFSVCAMSIGYLFYRVGIILYPLYLSIVFTSLILSIFSLSKAAIVANFLCIVFILFPRTKNLKILWIVLLFPLISYIIYITFAFNVLDDFLFVRRIDRMFEEDDSTLSSRGYFIFLEGNVTQLIFGMGSKIVIEILNHEVHSTLGAIINNYGIFGLLIFSLLILTWLRPVYQCFGLLGTTLIFVPSFLYGITHNGIRFTIFWLLISLSYSLSINFKTGNGFGHVPRFV